jgi:hypothetical protein
LSIVPLDLGEGKEWEEVSVTEFEKDLNQLGHFGEKVNYETL